MLAYFLINVLIITVVFSGGFNDIKGIFFGILAYMISLVIALSPVGEWILRLQMGCKKIERLDHKARLEPLFNEVLAKAKKISPSIPNDVELFINNDQTPNAFATGRKTICLTQGILNLSDEQIKAIFAHELGHLGNKDTDFILMITIGNFIVTGIFIVYRFIVTLLGITISFASESFGGLILTFLIDLVLIGAMALWTKLGVLLVMHSSRQNEYEADKFAHNCGYGNNLIEVLEEFKGISYSTKGLWANLAASHPEPDSRIAKLQELNLQDGDMCLNN